MSDFNFDQWSALAKENPAQFEKEKEIFLMSTIDSFQVSDETKLQLKSLAKQLCVKTTGSPMEKAQHASNLMLESLNTLTANLKELAVIAQPTSLLNKYTTLKKK